MRYLLATDSVHTTAAVCDYLQERAGADDEVYAVHVQSEDTDARDGREALNVATVRLGSVATVETDQRSGSPPAEIRAAAVEFDVDEIVVGPHAGTPEADAGAGSVVLGLLESASRPVVVVPME